MAEVYGNGEIRLTVEQNVIIPNVPDSRLPILLAEPLLQRFSDQSLSPKSGAGVLHGRTVLQLCPGGNQAAGLALAKALDRRTYPAQTSAHPLDRLP
jgi:ferredoxin-nitrite reductase